MSQPVFYLESKVGAPLKEEQLVRYRSNGAYTLLAITKHYPEVAKRRLERLGVRTIRWQDLHRALVRATPAPTDQFVVAAFNRYLEELGMAYDEAITKDDLNEIAGMFRGISVKNSEGFRPTRGMNAACRCISLLSDLQREFSDIYDPVAGFHRWTPGYFNIYPNLTRRSA